MAWGLGKEEDEFGSTGRLSIKLDSEVKTMLRAEKATHGKQQQELVRLAIEKWMHGNLNIEGVGVSAGNMSKTSADIGVKLKKDFDKRTVGYVQYTLVGRILKAYLQEIKADE